MTLKYSLTFVVLAVGCTVAAMTVWDALGWVGLILLYPSVSFLLLSIAYAAAGASFLGKQATGHISLRGWLLFAPYFLLNAIAFRIYRLLSSEPAYVLIAPNVYFGRRLLMPECAMVPWVGVLDLAGEFAECRPLRALGGYRSLAVLDATAPTESELRSAVAWIVEHAATGPVYVHCALGHGRSACVVIAYLLSAGIVGTVSEGERQLQVLRSGVRLHPCQRERLCSWEPTPSSGARDESADERGRPSSRG